ncbi:MAG: malto-oligosyltrehalose trehalohydrolase [Gemmatimonadales bacterium]
MIFRVWAPRTRAVTLVLDGARVPMRAGASGWWSGDVPAAPGARYRFALDDGEPLADPRSHSQPDGVFGSSMVVDHAAFPWTDAGWQPPPLAAGVIYELHVGTFTPEGTFAAAVARLDHLAALGVTHVEVMPLNEFAGTRGWGYDGVLPFAPHHGYGGPEGFKRFVNACHARGLAVLVDVVYNHFGPEGNVADRYGPYTTERYRTPWGAGINFDGPGSDAVRRFFCDSAVMWLRDYHCDGLRIDAIHAITDMSARHVLEQLALETEELSAHLGRPLTLVAESDLNDPRPVRPREAGGYGLHAMWSDDFHHAMHVTLTGERDGYYADFTPFTDVARALERGFVYEGQYAPHRGRSHGRPARGMVHGRQLVACLQNHDQVGNRARGDRLSHLVSADRCRVAAALLFTAPFIPLVFQGEEWGATSPFPYFCDHTDAELVRATREGRRREFAAFGWKAGDIPDPQDPATHAAARLCWEEMDAEPHRTMLAWYRRLIALRRADPDLTDGRLDRCRVAADAQRGWLTVRRGRVLVAANLGRRAHAIPLEGEPATMLAAAGDVEMSEADAGTVTLGPDAAAVLGVGGD